MKKSIPVIFDTDMDVDCDDTGALAVLHALMDNGEAEIQGIICDVPSINSAFVAKAINSYYNRPNIPIGIVEDDAFITSKKYERYRTTQMKQATLSGYYPPKIAEEFGNIKFNKKDVSESINLYRKLLSKAEDESVIIIAVGLLTALALLLESDADDISPLSGGDLVHQKVRKLITMGVGHFPSAQAEFNWLMDWDSARRVINHWKAPLVVTALGSQFLNGKTLSKKTPRSNPVRRAYEIYMQGENRGNYSWDLIAVYHGVREKNPYFKEVSGYYITLDENLGKNYWMEDVENKYDHSYLSFSSSRVQAKKELERFLTKSPNEDTK